MAITSRGTAVLKFGTFVLSGYVVTDEELADEGESYQLENEIGDIITDISDFGQRGRQVFNFIPFATGNSFPAIGAVFTGPNSFKGIVRRRTITRSRKVPEAWRIETESFPDITLT
jgi:hypothetical protein